MKIQDHLVSKAFFELIYDAEKELYATQPQPESDELSAYYKSETYISHTDARGSFMERVYQRVKKFTIRTKLRHIAAQGKRSGILLDIGCGTGDFLWAAAQKGFQVVGVEPNAEARKKAVEKLSQPHLFEHLEEVIQNEAPHSFDVITLWHVLEHVPNYDTYLAQIRKLLKPDGLLVVAVPNFKSYDAIHYREFWAAYDVPRHLWHFSKTSIRKITEQHTMKVNCIKPMWFDAFYVSLLSEKYLSGRNRPVRAFFVGLWSNLQGVFSREYSSHTYFIKKSQKTN